MQGRAVRDEVGEVFPHLFFCLSKTLPLKFRQWLVTFDHCVHARDMQKSIAQDTWHVGVDLDNHCPCGFSCSFRGQHLNPKTHKAMFIWWADLQERHIEGERARREEGRDFRQKNRGIISRAGIDCLPVAWTYKQGVMTEVIVKTWPGERIKLISHQKEMDQFHKKS